MLSHTCIHLAERFSLSKFQSRNRKLKYYKMSTIQFSSLNDLQPKKTKDWRITVRVTSKWCQQDTLSGCRNGLNLILVDEEVN